MCSIDRRNCKCASVSLPQEMIAAWSTGSELVALLIVTRMQYRGCVFEWGKIMHCLCLFSCAILTADSTTGTPAISTTTVEIRKSSVMTTEITSKVEKSPTTASGNSSCPSTETEEEKAKRLLYCSLCKVAVNSASQLEAHNSGEMQRFLLCLNSSAIMLL